MPTLTVPADMTANLRHLGTATLRVPVVNNGSAPVTLAARAADETTKPLRHPGAAWIQSISPARLTVGAHKTGYSILHIRVPAGATLRTHFTNIIWTVAPTGHGQVTLSGGVGGTLRLLNASHKIPRVIATPAPSHGGPGVALVVALALLGGVLALALSAVYLRRQHGSHRGAP